jgi:hypothetical protein
MIFYKIKNNRVGPALRVEATAQAPHDACAGLAQALLNGWCLGPARQAQPIWSSIPPHDNDGPRLSCHHLVHHSTSFLSPLMPPPSHQPILGKGRRSMPPPPHHPILGRGRRSRHILPYSSDTSPDTDSRSGYCMSTRTFHIMRALSFLPLSDVPFVFPAFVLFFIPNLLPPPTVAADARRCEYEANRSCSWPFSVRAVEEDMVVPAMLRLS